MLGVLLSFWQRGTSQRGKSLAVAFCYLLHVVLRPKESSGGASLAC